MRPSRNPPFMCGAAMTPHSLNEINYQTASRSATKLNEKKALGY